MPYDAARDGVFFRSFARLHPRLEFPVGLLTMGVITAAGFVIGRPTSILALIQLLTVVMVLVQALAQILAVTVLRRRQPTCFGRTGCGSTRCPASSRRWAGS